MINLPKRFFQTVNKTFVKEALLLKNSVIIDVREPEETRDGYIPTASLIPLFKLTEEDYFPCPDKTKEIIVYCRSGKRSTIASLDLDKKGFLNVKNYQGSWLDWVAE